MEYEEFVQKYHITANKQQEAAIKSVFSNVLLLAVPGSGKTTTLIARAGYMIYCKKIPAYKILIITYTVAAAEDMKQRFIDKFGDTDVPEFRTINGICSKIIERYCTKTNTSSYTLLSDEKDRAKIITELLKTTGEYPQESDIRSASTTLTYIKNMLLKKEEISNLDIDFEYPGGTYTFYNDYKKVLKENHLMDYDDQMVFSMYFLLHNEWLLDEVRSKYPFVFVDEAQDTSKIQHKIIEIIVKHKIDGKEGRVFMVGDEDQSIYGFRAAYPEALLGFEDTYSNAKTLLLETNFRSDIDIVDVANRFIKKNIYRKKKTIVPFSKKDGYCSFYKVPNDTEQYKGIIKMLSDHPDTETAIIYRNNDSAIPLIDLFEKYGLSYNLKGKNSFFFTEKAVVDVMNIIRFSKRRNDADLFSQIYYKLDLFMTKNDLEVVLKDSLSIKSIPRTISARIFPKSDYRKVPWGRFEKTMDMLSKLPMDMAINFLTKDGGLYKKYMDMNGVNSNPLRILKLISADCKTLSELETKLEHLQQLMAAGKSTGSNITLSTIHASKGLEYDQVIMIDLFDGCLPSNVVDDYSTATLDELKLYEEERRLFYVGITRARHDLVLFGIKDKPISFFREASMVNAPKKTALANALLSII